MNYTNNAVIAFFASTPAFLMAVETPIMVTIISAIFLPIAFFLAGKGIDVFVKIYLEKQKKD